MDKLTNNNNITVLDYLYMNTKIFKDRKPYLNSEFI